MTSASSSTISSRRARRTWRGRPPSPPGPRRARPRRPPRPRHGRALRVVDRLEASTVTGRLPRAAIRPRSAVRLRLRVLRLGRAVVVRSDALERCFAAGSLAAGPAWPRPRLATGASAARRLRRLGRLDGGDLGRLDGAPRPRSRLGSARVGPRRSVVSPRRRAPPRTCSSAPVASPRAPPRTCSSSPAGGPDRS